MTKYSDLEIREQYLFNKIDNEILRFSKEDKISVLTALLDKYLSEALK